MERDLLFLGRIEIGGIILRLDLFRGSEISSMHDDFR